MQERTFFVYILTNPSNNVLYTGVTNNLERRLYEHRNNLTPGFASTYRCHKLVWYENTPDIQAAITREKQIKAGSRRKKIQLIEKMNPEWGDLSTSWNHIRD
jgi:putative endonuclease